MQENTTEENLILKVNKAITNGDLATLQQLYNQNEDIFHVYTPVGTVLHLAAEYNQSAIVKWLIEMGMDINIEDKNYGHTPIRNAISEGHVDLFKEMFQLGAKIYFENPKHPHQDPLFGAILAGSKEMAQLLIEHGADTTIRYFERKDAALMAKEQNQTEILALIQAHNATLPAAHVPRTTPKEEYDDEDEDYEDEEEEEEYEEPSSHAVIRAAFEEVYGPIQTTYYQNFPSEVPIQAHIIAPSAAHPYYVLFTTGMSDRAVGYNLLYVENMMKVPADWLDGEADWSDKDKKWPINWLIKLANIPHAEKTQPERGDIVSNNDGLATVYDIETHLSGMLILAPTDSDIQRLPIEGKEIRIDELVPVYKAEGQYAEVNGNEALQEKLAVAQVQEVIDFQRPAVVDMPASEGPSKSIKKPKKLSNSETIRQRFETEYGPIAFQFTHLTVESNPSIPISGNIIYLTKKHPYYVVCTLGVSDNVSTKESTTYSTKVVEMMKLPLNWVASEEEWTLPEKNWPLRLMAELGYHVRKNSLKLDVYTTFPVEGEIAAILSEYTNMTHLLARPPIENDVSAASNERFFIVTNQLIPIYESEMDYAEGIYGVDLIDYLEKQQADNVLVVNRPPSV